MILNVYEFQKHRISKKEFNNNTLTKSTLFVYDGNNVVAEYEDGTLTKRYLWGEDVSGSMNGAGGVGGLLTVTNDSESYYPSYDGNSNIVQYLDETQTSVAKFEYTPFGQLKSEAGSMPEAFHYRFSTKYHDTSTNLTVYRYRNYNANLGKWQTRDPLGEHTKKKQFNLLYGFVTNNSISKWDYLGKNPQDLVLKMLGYKLRKAAGVTLPDISIVAGVGVTFGMQAVFFPDTCEIGIYAYAPALVGVSLNPDEHKTKTGDMSDWERMGRSLGSFATNLSIGYDVSIGFSGQLAYYKGKDDANAKSWTKRFDGGTIGGGPMAKAGVGVYWSDDWIGFSVSLGISVSPVTVKTTPQWYWDLKTFKLTGDKKCICYALTAAMP